MTHVTDSGLAVTVAVTPTIVAVAVICFHPEDRCSQIGKFTSRRFGVGSNAGVIVGHVALLKAVRATIDATGGGEPGVVGTQVRAPGSMPSLQVSMTQ
jgi:hypothetical protein